MIGQVIYGTDTAVGLGVISSENADELDNKFVNAYNTYVKSNCKYMIPSEGSKSDEIFSLEFVNQKLYLMKSVFENCRDSAGRWNASTHAVILDAKETKSFLEAPKKLLYFDREQLRPYEAELCLDFNPNSIREVSLAEAMAICGFTGDDDPNYRKLMKCVYGASSEATSESQVLAVRIKSEEQMFACLQVIYHGMPRSMRNVILASNVPMRRSVISFVKSENMENIPWRGNVFDLETGTSNVKEYNIDLSFFEELMNNREEAEKIFQRYDEELEENWTDNVKHMKYLSAIFIADRNKDDPKNLSPLELEKMLSALLRTKNSCRNIEELFELYLYHMYNQEYSIKVEALANIMDMKANRFANSAVPETQNLAKMIKWYLLRMNLNQNPEKVKENLADKVIEQQKGSEYNGKVSGFLAKQFELVAKYLGVENGTAFFDDLLSNNLLSRYGAFDSLDTVEVYRNDCMSIAEACQLRFEQMRKTTAEIERQCVRLFDTRYYRKPQELDAYYVNYRNKINDILYFSPDSPLDSYEEAKEIIKKGFWDSYEENKEADIVSWLEAPKGMKALERMSQGSSSGAVREVETLNEIVSELYDLERWNGIEIRRYVGKIEKLLKTNEADYLRHAICEIMRGIALDPDSNFSGSARLADSETQVFNYINLFYLLEKYDYKDVTSENIFDLTADLPIEFEEYFNADFFRSLDTKVLQYYAEQLHDISEETRDKFYGSAYDTAQKVYDEKKKQERRSGSSNGKKKSDTSRPAAAPPAASNTVEDNKQSSGVFSKISKFFKK